MKMVPETVNAVISDALHSRVALLLLARVVDLVMSIVVLISPIVNVNDRIIHYFYIEIQYITEPLSDIVSPSVVFATALTRSSIVYTTSVLASRVPV
jgi:hypothetical protein